MAALGRAQPGGLYEDFKRNHPAVTGCRGNLDYRRKSGVCRLDRSWARAGSRRTCAGGDCRELLVAPPIPAPLNAKHHFLSSNPGAASLAAPIIAHGRNALFSGLFLLVGLNSLAGQVLRSLGEQDVLAAFGNLFGVSAIVWVALAAGISILYDGSKNEPVHRPDIAIAIAMALVVFLPMATASMIALTILSFYAILSASPASPLRRSGIIFLAMAGTLLWGRFILALLSRPLLDLDAAFVAALLGAQREGNMLWFADAPSRLIVAPGCSSMQGMSLAILLWATINQFFKVRFGWKPLLWCLAALAATVGINVLRIGAMLAFPAYHDAIHVGWGFHTAMWATLVAVAGICIYGAKREIFGHG